MNTVSLLKPENLIPIRNLSLRARMIVEGAIAGLHKSPFHGFSSEFLEYRSYLTGESSRRIDWRKYAKSDRTVVRLFEDETNLAAHILVDKSGSMRFGSSHFTKFEYARTLAASLAWILIRQHDAVGLMTFDQKLDLYIPPRSTNLQLKTILTSLDKTEPSEQTSCGEAMNAFAQGLRKRGLCVIISDFFDEPSSIVKAFRHLRFKKQDVLVLWILDPIEREFKGNGSIQLRDLETGEMRQLDSSVVKKFMNQGILDHKNKLENICRELSIDFETVVTDEPFQKALLRVLEKRRRLY